MPLTSGDITALQALAKPRVAFYLHVIWDEDDSAEDRYYSSSKYNEMSGFLGIGLDIEPQILVSGDNDSLAKSIAFELDPDIKTEKISLRFNNVPDDDGVRPVLSRFATFGSGVRCELFGYFPDVDEHQSFWTGQFQAPTEGLEHAEIKITITNGYRSREQLLPKRMRPRECTANFPNGMSAEALATNGCPYNPPTLGNYRTGTTPYKSCPRNSTSACNTRLGTSDGKYYLGFDTDASATVTSGNPRVGPAISKGNQSTLTKPIRVIYGQKYVRDMPLLLWRREVGAPNRDHDWVSGIWEVGEGPVSQVYALKVVGGRPPQDIATQIRLGARGQAAISNYSSSLSNFSGTALVRAKYGWINATETNASDMTCEGRVIGMTTVPVYTDDDPLTFSRTYSDNRAWCLFDLMTHQRYGMGYAHSRFAIADWITVANWTNNSVSFTATDLDGNTVTYTGRRSTFDAICEGRPVAEQIEDICRSGGFSMPFLHDGKFTIREFRPATSGELSAAKVFTDTGENKNILWDGKRPSVVFGQIPPDKLVNEITLTFEEAANEDVERPITIDDPNQKLAAGRYLGDNNLQSVNKKYSAFGCGHTQEVVRLGYRLLRFGEFDSGGTQNNLNGTFTTTLIDVLGLKKYDIIKLETTLDDDFTIGTNDGVTNWEVTPEYYRIMSMKKTGNGRVEVKIQAYNHTAYQAFETVTSSSPPVFNVCSIDADCPTGYVCRNGICVPAPPPPPCGLAFTSTPTYDSATNLVEILIEPC